MTTGQLTVPVPFDVADELDTVHEYLDDRVIGRVPAAPTALLQAVARAETRTIVLQLVDDDGQPFEAGPREPLSAEEEARIDEAVAAAPSSAPSSTPGASDSEQQRVRLVDARKRGAHALA